MSEVTFNNPPIREAVFDVRYGFSQDVTIELLNKIVAEFEVEYPTKNIIYSGRFSFKVDASSSPEVDGSKSQHGFRLTSKDGLQILQIRRDGFSFSRLKPYTRWEAFSGETRKVMAIFERITEPNFVSRLALRYINVIDIPASEFVMGDYFSTRLHIAEGLKCEVDNFFLNLTVVHPDNDVWAVINQTRQPSQSERGIDITPILFDIDVFQDGVNFRPNSQEFWDRIEKIKEFRTMIFQSGITDKARELFS